jgi:hypothetical protein
MRTTFKWVTEVCDYEDKDEFKLHKRIMRNRGFVVKECYKNECLKKATKDTEYEYIYTAIWVKHEIP